MLEHVPPSHLRPWAGNPRTDQPVAQVAASIRRFGFGAPIVARRADRMVIAGHTRLLAAKQLGLQTVPVIYMDLTAQEAQALALADNKLGETAQWDHRKLTEALLQLQDSGAGLDDLGWDESELEHLLQDLPDLDVAESDLDLPGESEWMIWRMSTLKEDKQRVMDVLSSLDGGPTGQAERLGWALLQLASRCA